MTGGGNIEMSPCKQCIVNTMCLKVCDYFEYYIDDTIKKLDNNYNLIYDPFHIGTRIRNTVCGYKNRDRILVISRKAVYAYVLGIQYDNNGTIQKIVRMYWNENRKEFQPM